VFLNAPHLVELEMACCFCCLDNLVLWALCYSEDDAVHMTPRLRKLRVEHAGYRFHEDVLRKMILSRWWSNDALANLPLPPPVAPWKSIDISRGDDEAEVELTEDFQANMEALQREGLQVDVE